MPEIQLLELGEVLYDLLDQLTVSELQDFAETSSQSFEIVEELAKRRLFREYGHTQKYLDTWLQTLDYASQEYWIRDLEYTVPIEPNGYVKTFDGSYVLLSNGSFYKTFGVFEGTKPKKLAENIADFAFETVLTTDNRLLNIYNNFNPVEYLNDQEHSSCFERRPNSSFGDLKLMANFIVDSENYFFENAFAEEINCGGQLPVTPLQICQRNAEMYRVASRWMIGVDQNIYLISWDRQNWNVSLFYQNPGDKQFIAVSGDIYPNYDDSGNPIPSLDLVLTCDRKLYRLDEENPNSLTPIWTPWDGRIDELVNSFIRVGKNLYRIDHSPLGTPPLITQIIDYQVNRLGREPGLLNYGLKNDEYDLFNHYQWVNRSKMVIRKVSEPNYLRNRLLQADIFDQGNVTHIQLWVSTRENTDRFFQPRELVAWYPLAPSIKIWNEMSHQDKVETQRVFTIANSPLIVVSTYENFDLKNDLIFLTLPASLLQ